MSRIRSALVATLLVTSLAACQKRDAEAHKSLEVNGRSTDLAELRKDAAQAEKGALKGTRPIAPATLPSLLPASVAGYARGPVEAEPGSEPGMNQAQARYAKGPSSFSLQVTDLGAIGAVGAPASDVGATSTRKTPTGYETISTAGGRTTTEAWDVASKSGRYSIFSAGRYTIAAEGAADDVTVLKAAVEAANAERMKALAAK